MRVPWDGSIVLRPPGLCWRGEQRGAPSPALEQSSSSCRPCFIPAVPGQSSRGTASAEASLVAWQRRAVPCSIEDEGDARRGHKMKTESMMRKKIGSLKYRKQ